MEKLNYLVEDATIAEVLGVQNFSNKESAILELVKNAYDAGAFNLDLQFIKDDSRFNLFIRDDGTGMDEKDLKSRWMHVGKSQRTYIFKDSKNKERIYSGSKGIGRFALARLGKKVQVYTRKTNEKSVYWLTDWNEISYEIIDDLPYTGTTIKIFDLRDKWSEIQIQQLSEYLSRTCNMDEMKIRIVSDNSTYYVKKYFDNDKLSINYSNKIHFKYDSNKNTVDISVDSDEFKNKAKEITKINTQKFFKQIDVFKDLLNSYQAELSKDMFQQMLVELGDFKGEFFFGIGNCTAYDIERFMYKNRSYDMKKSNVILYRNAFSISGYDGKKDWLLLNTRSRKSPAAASHKTGAWKVRSNQLTGSVTIDKKNNPYLTDLSNRQGLDENIYFDIFMRIIDIVLSSFERYRQSIIRKIDSYNTSKKKSKKQTKIVDKIIKSKQTEMNLNTQDFKKLQDELINIKSRESELNRENKETEDGFKYDVQILNVLATLGLKSSLIAHQVHNNKNFLYSYYNDIVNALKSFNLWDEIVDLSDTDHKYKNVPLLLSRSNDISRWMIKYMETVLEELRKDYFITKKYLISELLFDISRRWQWEYSWVKINLNVLENIEIDASKDSIQVIFDNLILNSIQQNDNSKEIIIDITVSEDDNRINFTYRDNGVGLNEKYLNDPFKILEVHETSRKFGHGLGMWILNNTIHYYDGEVKAITSENGFKIEFYMISNGEAKNESY